MSKCRLCGSDFDRVLKHFPTWCDNCIKKEERRLTDEAIAAATRRLKEWE